MKSSLSRLAVLAVLLGSVACATVPKEAVDLSVTVGRDLGEVHRSHRELAIRYFDRMDADIESFVTEVYRPFMIRKTIEDFELVAKIQAGLQPGADPDALDVMDVYVTEVMADLEDYRAQLRGTLLERRASVLRSIDDAYAAIQAANSVVTGHLASVRRVHEEQDALLAKAGLTGFRERFIDTTAGLSDRIAETVERGRRGEEKVDAVAESLKKLVETKSEANDGD